MEALSFSLSCPPSGLQVHSATFLGHRQTTHNHRSCFPFDHSFTILSSVSMSERLKQREIKLLSWLTRSPNIRKMSNTRNPRCSSPPASLNIKIDTKIASITIFIKPIQNLVQQNTTEFAEDLTQNESRERGKKLYEKII